MITINFPIGKLIIEMIVVLVQYILIQKTLRHMPWRWSF